MTDHPRTAAIHLGRRIGQRYRLAAPRRASLGLIGSQLGHGPGASLEYHDHRAYEIGDDLRSIDWAAFARTDRLTVRLYRQEISPHLDIVLDGSASMSLPAAAKPHAALALAAALATAAAASACSHALHLAAATCQPLAPPSTSPEHWPAPAFDARQSLDLVLAAAPPPLRPRSIRVLISDLLFDADPAAVLQPLARNAAALLVIQVLDESEIDPPQRGLLRLTEAETGRWRDVMVDAALAARYRAALASHQETWRRAAIGLGAAMISFPANALLRSHDLRPLIEAQLLRTA